MDSFFTLLKQELDSATQFTENGAVGFKTTGHKLLDLNFATSSLRAMEEADIVARFMDAFYESPMHSMLWLFMLRDVRGGMGERRSFRICMKWLASVRPDIVKRVLPLVSEYGRWDDLLEMLDIEEVKDDVVTLIDTQLTKDVAACNSGKSISLLAKWLPSVNTSSKATVEKARKLCAALSLSERQYRKTLSMLRRSLNLVECHASAKEWDKINYDAVPSKANLKYKDAFLANDHDRRVEWLEKLTKGEAKVNASALFPYEIVQKLSYAKQTDTALEAMWKALPDYVSKCQTGSTIVVADGSGSMYACASLNARTRCSEVCQSLAIYFAEHLSGAFKDKFITFSAHPQLVDLKNCKSLYEKIKLVQSHSEVANTNIEAVFDLILKTAIQNNLSQQELPSNILVCSDMEFDECVETNTFHRSWGSRGSELGVVKMQPLFDTMKNRYEAAGYKLPRVVFWNIGSRTNTVPMKENTLGVALVSGFSPAIASQVFSMKTDPWECLVESLLKPRYQPVRDALSKALADNV